MSEGRHSLKISEVCLRVTSGGTPRRNQPDYFGGSIPWLKTKELTDRWLDESEEHITEEGLESSSAKLLPRTTVLMAMYGATVGKLGILGREMACNQAACALIVDPSVAHFRYVYYLLLNNRQKIMDLANGAAQQNLSAATIKDLEFEFPSVEEQRKVSAVLGALDDKILNNERILAKCLALSKLLFQQVSVGARSIQLDEVASVVLGGTPSRKVPEYWSGGDIPWINSGVANRDVIVEPTDHITSKGLDNSAAKLMPAGSTVLAITGATLGQVALLGIETAGNQSLVGIWADDSALTSWLYFAVSDAIPQLVGRATGAAQQHVNKGDVASLSILLPERHSLENWFRVCGPLVDRAICAARESKALAELRDALLPGLLSGQVSVLETATVG